MKNLFRLSLNMYYWLQVQMQERLMIKVKTVQGI